MRGMLALLMVVILTLTGCSRMSELKRTFFPPHNIIYAGARSSSYGIKPFPDPESWEAVLGTMSGYFPDSTPCAIWIIGVLYNDHKSCRMEFPSDGNNYDNIVFLDYDKHEEYLSRFDEAGIKVFLQVEPANADIFTLIDVVLNRYKHHSSVIGFGVDVEWYHEAEYSGRGEPVDDSTAQKWEARVKSHNKTYKLFLKHWDRKWMPPTYRGDLVFVDDSQGFDNFERMIAEFTEYWSDYFYPNLVLFQIGYRKDRSVWDKFNNPPKYLGQMFASKISQNCGVIWVDFTLRDVIPSLATE